MIVKMLNEGAKLVRKSRELVKQSQGGGQGGHNDNKDQKEFGQGEEDRQKLCSGRDVEREMVTQKGRKSWEMVTGEHHGKRVV